MARLPCLRVPAGGTACPVPALHTPGHRPRVSPVGVVRAGCGSRGVREPGRTVREAGAALGLGGDRRPIRPRGRGPVLPWQGGSRPPRSSVWGSLQKDEKAVGDTLPWVGLQMCVLLLGLQRRAVSGGGAAEGWEPAWWNPEKGDRPVIAALPSRCPEGGPVRSGFLPEWISAPPAGQGTP